MKYLFPLSFKVRSTGFSSLVLVCAIYLVVYFVVKWLCSLVSVALLAFNIISAVVAMYCLMGVIAAVLVKMKRL